MMPRSLYEFLYDLWDSLAEVVDSILERMGQ